MKDVKREYCFFRAYDVKGMEAHLEEMAQNGWMIAEFGTRMWKYEKEEPKKLKFHFQYKTDDLSVLASYAGDEEKEKMASDSAQERGWNYAGTWNNGRIYYTENIDAAPFEEDKERITGIRAASNKMLVSVGIIGGLLVVFFGMNIPDMVKYPMDFYGDSTGIILMLMMILAILALAVTTISQILWIKKAERMGTVPYVNTKRNKRIDMVGLIVVILLGIMLILSELKASNTETGILFISMLVFFLICILLERKMLSSMKKKKVSKVKQWLAVGGLIAVMLLVLFGGTVKIIMSDDFSMENNDAGDAPLMLQDFMTFDEKESFSYDYSHGKSPMLEKISMTQYGDEEYLDIYIAKVRNEKRFDWFLTKALSEYGSMFAEGLPGGLQFSIDDFWQEVDEPEWGVDKVYCQKDEETGDYEYNTWMLAKKPYIISVDLSFSIDQGKKMMIVQRLLEQIDE